MKNIKQGRKLKAKAPQLTKNESPINQSPITNHQIKQDNWCIIEEGFKPKYNRISESIFSIGNGRMGQRANFEENYSGNTLQGSYIAGVYYPDKTKVGWWKNGYPKYLQRF